MAYTLQLKRHLNYEDRNTALAGLKAYLATAAVGEPAIATYGGGEDIVPEKVLFGIKGAEDYTIFDADAIPSEVQDALDNAIAAIKGGDDAEINDAYDTIKKIADALVIINGSGEGSIAKAEQDAKDYADAQITAAVQALDVADTAVAKSFITEVSETDGKIAVKRGAITSKNKTVVIGDGTDGGIDLKANVDGTTIVVNGETGVMSVASAALVQYVGQDAIAVSEEDEGEKTISLKLNTADQILTQTTDGLLANLNLTWSNADGLKLIGKDGAEIATIPATDFVKDGMLQNVELKTATAEDPIDKKTSGTFLVFTFNTDAGSKVINLDVTSLIDVYTAGDGISVTGKVIAAKLDASTEAFLTVGADGIKLSGVQAAIDAAKQAVQTAIDEEKAARQAADTALQTEVDAIETAVGLNANGTFIAPDGSNYTDDATSVMDAISKLDTQAKTNANAIAAETTRATKAEQQLQEAIDAVESAAISVVAGNGINISGSGTEKTITAVAKVSDPMIEVTNEGIGLKDDAVFDCGTY